MRPDGRRTVRRRLGLAVAGAAATFALAGCGATSDGTVVAKTDQGPYDYACGAGARMINPFAVPVWGACSDPKCWRLVVQHEDGTVSEPCVSRSEYDSTEIGGFYYGGM